MFPNTSPNAGDDQGSLLGKIAQSVSDSPSGGSTISDPEVAYIRSDGNNATAEIGNPSKPYLTFQAAVTAGAIVFDFGVGNFGAATLPTGYYYVRGRGISKSVVGSITATGTIQIFDTGIKTVTFGSVSLPYGETGTFFSVIIIGDIDGSASGSNNAANVVMVSDSYVTGNITCTSFQGIGGSVTLDQNSGVGGNISVQQTSGSGTDGSITLKRGGEVAGTLTPDAATVAFAIVAGTPYATHYP